MRIAFKKNTRERDISFRSKLAGSKVLHIFTNMSCAAYGCDNKKRKNKDKTFFSLPKDPLVKKAWIAAIGTKDLPIQIFVCSDHFDKSCYDPSWDRQVKEFYNDRPCKRRLLPKSIPTIFAHKRPSKERATSKSRAEKKQSKEVSLIYIEICFFIAALLIIPSLLYI